MDLPEMEAADAARLMEAATKRERRRDADPPVDLETIHERARLAAKAAASVKAEDVKILDMHELVTYTDYLVLCTGRNVPSDQVGSPRRSASSSNRRRAFSRPAAREWATVSGSFSTTSTSWSTCSRPKRAISIDWTSSGSERRSNWSSDVRRRPAAVLPIRGRGRPTQRLHAQGAAVIMRGRLAVGV